MFRSFSFFVEQEKGKKWENWKKKNTKGSGKVRNTKFDIGRSESNFYTKDSLLNKKTLTDNSQFNF